MKNNCDITRQNYDKSKQIESPTFSKDMVISLTIIITLMESEDIVESKVNHLKTLENK